MSEHTAGPWLFEPIEKFPFGFAVRSADGKIIVSQSAVCWASDQKTRRDNEKGVGFKLYKRGDSATADEAAYMIAEQDANARLIAAAPDFMTAAIAAIQSNMLGTAEESVTISRRAYDMLREAIAKAEGRS